MDDRILLAIAVAEVSQHGFHVGAIKEFHHVGDAKVSADWSRTFNDIMCEASQQQPRIIPYVMADPILFGAKGVVGFWPANSDGDDIVLHVSRQPEAFGQHSDDYAEVGRLWKWTIDTKRGKVTEELVDAVQLAGRLGRAALAQSAVSRALAPHHPRRRV